MSPHIRGGHPVYGMQPTDIEGFDSLAALALDMRWSWNHATDGVWRTLDPTLWKLTRDPWVVLQTVSRNRLESQLADPRRPWEACGTSRMKVLVNGGLNSSELDGWWAEAYVPEVGWALGDGQEHRDDPAGDAAEADALYDLLERTIIPEFYSRDESGIPATWVARMRESMAQLAPRFSADRAVRDYTERHYLPSAAAYRERAADHGAAGRQLVARQRAMQERWDTLRVGNVTVRTRASEHIFEAEVYLNDLDREVRVELYTNGTKCDDAIRQELTRVQVASATSPSGIFRASVPATRPATDYTVRVIPHRDGLAVPLEDARILWQR